MTKPSNSKPEPISNPSAELDLDPLGAAWLAVVSGLFFLRWWQPTEGTAQGNTLPITLGWFAALTLIGWVGLRGTLRNVRRDGLQTAVWMIVGGHILSGLIVCYVGGERRSAINLIWEWLSLGVSFPLLRQFLNIRQVRSQWLILALSASLTLALYGMTQRYVFYPATVREYERIRSELDQLEMNSAEGQAVNAIRMQDLQNRLLLSGLSPHMLHGTGRALFESRLKHSTEALGMFALANTFGGFLLVWMIVWMGQALSLIRERMSPSFQEPVSLPQPARQHNKAALIFSLLASGALAYSLLLTKSRTAFFGVLAGVSFAVFLYSTSKRQLFRRLVMGGGTVILIFFFLAGIATLFGALDSLVWSEAPKSLRYRLEYWWGSLEAIRETPIFGTGPGQFRTHYLMHKLPRSSEEIADPHNLILDVWANGGIVALAGLAFLISLIAFPQLNSFGLRPFFNRYRSTKSPLPVSSQITQTIDTEKIAVATSILLPQQGNSYKTKIIGPKNPHSPTEKRNGAGSSISWYGFNNFRTSPVAWGAWGMALFFWITFGGMETALGVVICGWIGISLFVNWLFRNPNLHPEVWMAASLGLVVHLTGAGGIGMPALFQLLLIALIFVVDSRTWRDSEDSSNRSPIPGTNQVNAWGNGFAIILGIGLFAGDLLTGWRPVWTSRLFLEEGDYAQSLNRRGQRYRQAALADPWSSEPWERLAQIAFNQAIQNDEGSLRALNSAIESMLQAIRRDPLNFHHHRALSQFYLERWKRSGRESDKKNATEAATTALKSYPHNAELLSAAAQVFFLANDKQMAAKFAKLALQQDQINRTAGHTDKMLLDDVNAQLKIWADSY